MKFFQGNVGAFREAWHLLACHWELTFEMARREISDRYVGQAFGMFWAFGHPIFLMGLYVFIFAIVFKLKVGGTLEMPLDYTTYILSGLIPWMAFQESINKSCTAITANASLVNQVMFPLEVLPTKVVVGCLLSQLISTVILIAYVLVTYQRLLVTYVLLPFLIFMQVLSMLGVGYLLSAIGAYFRDTKEFVQLYGLAGMYLIPVFYLPGWIPDLFKPLLYVNPFTYLIWCYQDALYFGRFEHPWAWVVNFAFSVTIFIFGYRVFKRLKSHFGDVV